MKDWPVLLLAVLAARCVPELAPVFARVVNHGKMPAAMQLDARRQGAAQTMRELITKDEK